MCYDPLAFCFDVREKLVNVLLANLSALTGWLIRKKFFTKIRQ